MLAALDCETTGLNLFHSDLPFMCCITFEDKRQETFEWPVDPLTRIPSFDLDDLYEIVCYLEDSSIEWVLHNAKFDVRCIEMAIKSYLSTAPVFPYKRLNPNRLKIERITNWNPLDILSVCHDTVLMAHAYDNLGSHALKDLGVRFLAIGEDDEYDLKMQVESIIPYAKQLGWRYACAGHCLQVRKGPTKGWAVMDMWLPKAYRNYQMSLIGDTSSSSPQEENLDVFDNKCRTYCLQDTIRTIRLFPFFKKYLEQEKLWEQYLEQREQLAITYDMEAYGVTVHRANLESEQKRFRTLARYYEAKARRIVLNMKLNLNATEQIARELYYNFGIRPKRNTKAGKPTIDKQELEELYHSYSSLNDSMKDIDDELSFESTQQTVNVESLPYIEPAKLQKLLDFLMAAMSAKKCDTAADSHLEGYKYIMTRYDVIHSSFNLTGTKTTRLSCSYLHNVSKGKNAFNDEIKGLNLSLRKVFGPTEGRKWWSVDYKQLQLVVFATISGEQSMIRAVEKGEDFHGFTHRKIAEALGWEYDPDDEAQRTIGKNVNFGFIFGAGAAKLEKTARTPGLYSIVENLFPTAHDFLKFNIKSVKKIGYVTACGYRLYVPPETPYAATNYRVQGWEGRIIKKAMKYCWEYLNSSPQEDIHLMLNVHDELVFDAPINADDRYLKQLMKLMEQAGKDCGIPCRVDAKVITTNWAEGKDFEMI